MSAASAPLAQGLPDPEGLSNCAFYVAANGYATEAASLVPTCREYALNGGGGGSESLLRCLLVYDARAPAPGLVTMHPRLLAAVRVGDPARIKELVGFGADVCIRDGSGLTALMIAARHGRVAAASTLLAMPNVDVSARVAFGSECGGHSALSIACEQIATPWKMPRSNARASPAAVVRVLAAMPLLVGPADICGTGASALSWVCRARLLDVVAQWLHDARAPTAIILRDDDGHTAFSRACSEAAYAGEQEGAVHDPKHAAAMARALAESRLMCPSHIGGGNASALTWACKARLLDVVERWLADPRCTAEVLTTIDGGAESPFSHACRAASDDKRFLTEDERDMAAACARALAASPFMSPSDWGGDEATALSWACTARLPDVVRCWIVDARCTAAVATDRDLDGHSAFSRACIEAAGVYRDNDTHERCELSDTERAKAVDVVLVLARSPLIKPDSLGGDDATALSWVCEARQFSIVSTWLAHPRCTPRMLTALDARGFSAFARAATWAFDRFYELLEADRDDASQCARLLASSPHVAPDNPGGGGSLALAWACSARLTDVVTTWLADPRCTPGVVAQRDHHGHTAFSRACSLVTGFHSSLYDDGLSESQSAEERGRAVDIVHLLEPRVDPGDLGGKDASALAWACTACLEDVVSTLLERCDANTVALRDAEGHTAFTRAAELATCSTYDWDRKDERDKIEFAAAAAIARKLAASLLTNPGSIGGGGASGLSWACSAQLADVVETWLASGRCTPAVMAQRDSNGHTVFSRACAQVRSSKNEGQRATVMSIACSLAPHMSPSTIGGDDATALAWSCTAGLDDLTAKWLNDPLCTRDVILMLDNHGHSAFSRACGQTRGTLIARTLSSWHKPGDILGNGATAFAWACFAHLDDIAVAWLAQDRSATNAIVTGRDNQGHSVFSRACELVCGNTWQTPRCSTPQQKAAAATAVTYSAWHGPGDVLGDGATALAWACSARLTDVVARWLADAHCTVDVVTMHDIHGDTAFSRVCLQIADFRHLDAAHACGDIARKLADRAIQPATRNRHWHTTALLWACKARLSDVVAQWVADRRCTREIVALRESGEFDYKRHSAFSLVCEQARNAYLPAERAEAAATARALSPLVAPDALGGNNATAFAWACSAHLTDVVTVWLADARCSANVIEQCDDSGDTPFSRACGFASKTHLSRQLTVFECAAAAATASLLSNLTHPDAVGGNGASAFAWAVTARFTDVVKRWMKSLPCAADAINARDENDGTAWSRACAAINDAAPFDRAAAVTTASMLMHHVKPDATAERGATALALAITARLSDVVLHWLKSPLFRVGVGAPPPAFVAASSGWEKITAWSRACTVASDAALTPMERDTAELTARSLSRFVAPDAIGGGASALAWAVLARLTSVVSRWLPLCTADVINALDSRGCALWEPLFSLANHLEAADKYECPDASVLHEAAACALALAHSPHVPTPTITLLRRAATTCERFALEAAASTNLETCA